MPDPRPATRLAAILALGVAGLVAACGSPAGPSQPPIAQSPSDSAGPETSVPSPTAAPSPTGGNPPASAPVASPGASASTPASVPIDPGLMDVLPATLGGLPVTPVPDPTGTDDPGLVGSVDRMEEAVVIDPASGDFAYASVIVLQPGVFDDAYFRSWRDSFDEGACSQAGGVSGHAQATIGGRTAYLGTCAGGVQTYHVRLEGLDAIVSVSSLGASRLGEQLVAGLRP